MPTRFEEAVASVGGEIVDGKVLYRVAELPVLHPRHVREQLPDIDNNSEDGGSDATH